MLARLGVPTGDGRIIAPGGVTNRELPLPLMWQEMSGDGHGGSRVVGAIETLDFSDPSMARATGSFLASVPQEAIEQIEAGVIGPSVDLDDVEYVMDADENLIITKGRIAGATLVSIPAFSGVSIELEADLIDAVYPLVASVRSEGWSDMPIADEGRAWDGDAAADRVFAWATSDGETDWARYARAFLRKDDDANPETRGAYGFGVADVIDGTLTIVPRGVFAAAAAVRGARTGSAPEDAEAMKSVLRGIYDRMDRQAPFSLTASAAPPLPDPSWFAAPDLDRLTPLTVSDTGRVFGHIAGWGTCHVGMPGCVTPPSSPSGYQWFHVHSQALEGGQRLPVGVLTVGGGHADAQMGMRPAMAHYDDVGTAVAKVRAGEDEFGIWVAGWVLPQTTPEQREVFMSSPVSGDWRQSPDGSLDLIAVCSVNTPGFPVPRARVSFSHEGGQRSLVASFGVQPVQGTEAQARTGEAFVKRTETARARWRWATMQED